MSKLGLHLQSFPGWVPEFLRVSGAPYIKILDGPEDNPNPGTRVIVRGFMPDHESNELIWRGAAGADAWFGRWRPWMQARGWAWAFEGPNEPQPMANADFRQHLDEFTEWLAYLFTAERIRLVGHNWGVGWPDVGHAPEFAKSIRALHGGGHVLGVHEYSAAAMWDREGWYCLRYRKTVAELRNAGIPIPKVLIGETGIDGGVIGRPKQGWCEFASEDEYLAQLAWYDAHLMADDYVVAAAIFTTCDWDWHSFGVDESLGMKLARYIADNPTPEPEPPVPPPPPEPPPEPPSPEPVPDHWRELFDRLDRIIELLR